MNWYRSLIGQPTTHGFINQNFQNHYHWHLPSMFFLVVGVYSMWISFCSFFKFIVSPVMFAIVFQSLVYLLLSTLLACSHFFLSFLWVFFHFPLFLLVFPSFALFVLHLSRVFTRFSIISAVFSYIFRGFYHRTVTSPGCRPPVVPSPANKASATKTKKFNDRWYLRCVSLCFTANIYTIIYSL